MTTDITALAQSLKNAASKALIEEGLTWFSEEQLSHEDGIAIHKADAEFIALANPANVLALVESLEKAQKRISQLESRTVKLPDDEDGQAYGFGKWANGKLPATAGTMTIAYCEDAWRAAFEVFSSAAGIKVEAE
ncbi:TPA: ead/Ea22-like family protein [Klebsiella pneumoniae]|nr:ead/Ea22-like family protein [Klebsiella pneumoniae]